MSIEFEFKDRYDIFDLVSIIALLRAPGGCPWDREQTHNSIKKNFIEETYEVIEAINNDDVDGLREELGDVLMQVALHCEMESERSHFDFYDVCDDLCKKLIIRHPHVFGDVVADNCQDALASWDAVKNQTKGIKKQSESMVSVPIELPALMRAQKVQGKASKVGFDWADADGAFEKVYEEINELKFAISQNQASAVEEEFGDLLFSCVNISRFIDVDSEEALKSATDKFIRRFKVVERLAEEQGKSMKDFDSKELDSLWEKAKEILTD
ncbi:MAG: nucleoside triphosphate pyrophosphohydrolase [Clostridiales bacterium]|nr:nucleoside triphosphate pyrophosphohydrolase [Clostridiales bacterium]